MKVKFTTSPPKPGEYPVVLLRKLSEINSDDYSGFDDLDRAPGSPLTLVYHSETDGAFLRENDDEQATLGIIDEGSPDELTIVEGWDFAFA